MKTLKCDRCEFEAQGETFDEWMNALKPHYGAVHAEVMQAKANISQEEQMTEMQTWMDANKTRFDEA